MAGYAVFTADPDTTRRVLDDDPGVRAGIFSYELHPVRGFSMIRDLPGFRAGTWLTSNDDGLGLSLTLWDTDERLTTTPG